MSEDVKFGISAEDVGFGAVLTEVQEKTTEAVALIKEKFESINETFEKVQAAFLAFTAVLAGGEAFKEMIAGQVNAVTSSASLGKQLGISTTEASQLRVAFDSTHVSQEAFQAANQKLTVTINKNEGAIKALGVETRNADGSFRNSLDVQLEVNEALMKVKVGLDRNIEGTKIYGKGWADAAGTLRVTTEAFEEAKRWADALGLSIGQEQVDSTKQYRDAIVEVHDVIEAFERIISAAVLPVLTEMAEWFKHKGPDAVGVMRLEVNHLATIFEATLDAAKSLVDGLVSIFAAIGDAVLSCFGQSGGPISAMELFKNSLKVVEVAFILVSGAIQQGVELIVGAFEIAGSGIKRLAATSTAMFNAFAGQGKWGDVAAAWDKGTAEMEAIGKRHADKMTDIGIDAATAIDDALMKNAEKAAKITDTTVDTSGKDAQTAEKLAKLMAELNAELEAKKAAWAVQQDAKGSFVQFSLEQEKEFWDANMHRAAQGSEQRLEMEKNSNKLLISIHKERYDDEIAILKEQETVFKTNLDTKLAIAKAIEAEISKAEGGRGPKLRAAGAEVVAIEQEISDRKLAIALAAEKKADAIPLAQVDAAEKAAELLNAQGVLSNKQLLDQDLIFEGQRFAIKEQALANERALLAAGPDNPAAMAENDAQRVSLGVAYQAKIQQIQLKAAEDATKNYKAVFNVMSTGFSTAFNNILSGNKSLSASMRGLFVDMEKQAISSLANIAGKILSNAMLAIATGKLQKLEEQEANAVSAGGAAWASAAKIPYVGWVLGPIAGAAAYAGVMAMAEGGYDIPAGVNPVVQAHAKEMILPPPLAERVRTMTDPQLGGGDTHIHLNVNAVDAKSVQALFKGNKTAIAAALKSHMKGLGQNVPSY